MPKVFITDDMRPGQEIEVFVYINAREVVIATTEKPLITAGQYGYLFVNDVNNIGAFCDWGVSKDLFIPFSNMEKKMSAKRKYMVYMYLDKVSDRLVGSTKLNKYLVKEADGHLTKGQEVDLLVYCETDLGYKVIINQKYLGLIYQSEVHQTLKPGQKLKGYIKPLREDKKIDVSLTPIGHRGIEPNALKILEMLEKNDGFLPFTDKSDPEMIRAKFGISKKLFKKSLGSLYKNRRVVLKKDGIYLHK